MKTVDITKVIEKIKPNMHRNLSSIPEYLNTVLIEVNRVAATGYRFVGIVYTPLSEDGCFLCFEKDKKYEYVLEYMDEATELTDQSEFRKILSKKNLHATVIFHGVVDVPVYFIAE